MRRFPLYLLTALMALCAVPAWTFYYTVQKGDTLTSVGKRFTVTPGQLRDDNGYLKFRNLQTGDLLLIRGKAPVPPPRAAPAGAADHPVPAAASPQRQSRAPTTAVGAVPVSRKGRVSTLRDGAHPPEPSGGQRYVVRKGDTLYSVGKKFRVPLAAMKKANTGAAANGLRPGMSIVVPGGGPAPGRTASRRGGGAGVRDNGSRPTATATAAMLSGYKFVWPLSGAYQLREGRSLYIQGAPGVTVTAAESGRVMHVNDYGAMGTMIAVKHGGELYSYYLYLEKSLVQPGQEVTKGQAIGTLGTRVETQVSGNHKQLMHQRRTELRFEVTHGKDCINPLKVL